MAGQNKSKLKTLFIMRFLQQNTDTNNGVTVEEIIGYLKKNGISAERKSIYNDIVLLRDFGMDIEPVRTTRNEYRLITREFQLPELKLLVDAVGASKFITRKKSLELLKKLEALASIYESRELRRSVYVDKRVKTMNEGIYYSVDSIHNAINNGKKLGFKYFTYDSMKNRIFKKSGDEYVVTPLALTYSDENYYLYAYSAEHNEVRTYRVDRITNAHELALPSDKNDITSNFDPASSSTRSFSMFGGEKRNITLRFSNELSTVVIDRFGSDIIFVPHDENRFNVSVDILVSPIFFGWIFSFGSMVEIVAPQEIRKEFVCAIKKSLKKHE